FQTLFGAIDQVGSVENALEWNRAWFMNLFLRIQMRHGQDWNMQLPQHALSYRPQHQVFEIRAPMRAHDHEVNFLVIDDAEKFRAYFSAFHDDLVSQALAAYERYQFQQIHLGLFIGCCIVCSDMSQNQPGIELESQRQPVAHSPLRGFRKINGHHYLLNANHDDPPIS